MLTQRLIVEEVDDPHERARFHSGLAHFEVNRDWLESHWEELLPLAAGRFIAVAGQQAFVADTTKAAWSWVEENHPDDEGAFVRFVRSQQGPRFYATFR